jgi:hypothetical protein
MKIYSEILESVDKWEKPVKVFVLYLDTQLTGNPEKDIKNCGMEMKYMDPHNPDSIISVVVPMITSLIDESFGNPSDKEPITEWHATGFDSKYVNGVNTGIHDK